MATASNPSSFCMDLPANLDAERTILGAMLLDNGAWDEIISTLRPDDFTLDSHKRIALRMSSLMKRETAVDIVTLAEELTRNREVEQIGGVAYLASLTEGLPRRPMIEEYIKIVKDKSLLRQLMSICSAGIARAADQSETALEVYGAVTTQIERVFDGGPVANNAPVQSFLLEALDGINAEYKNRLSPCIPSSNAWFTAKSGGGYRHGKMTIVAARPKVGKTGWATSDVAYNCKRGVKCVVFSLEMEKGEILRNLVPYVVDLPNVVVNRAWTQTPVQNQLVNEAMNTIIDWPLSVYDGSMDIDQVCWTMDRETRKGQEVLFVLDHFGLLGGAGKDIRARYVENSSRLRKKISHKKAALMALFQLLPVPRAFADNRPLPEDLKESKNPLEDCYAMVLLHRYIDSESRKMTRKANINLCLIRGGGSPGNIDGDFNPRKLCFEADAELELDDF